MVALCTPLINDWEQKILPILDQNRDAHELDVTPPEARDLKIVAGNETYIGRRVIATNIQRELPTFIQYLSGSYRHVCAKSDNPQVTIPSLNKIEAAYTCELRTGNWLEPHIQVISSDCLHGRGVFMVIPKKESKIDCVPVFVPAEDFIFPIETRDIQNAPLVGIKYVVSYTQFKDWATRYKWHHDTVNAIISKEPETKQAQAMFTVYLMMIKAAEKDPTTGQLGPKVVKAFWYSHDQTKVLTAVANLAVGRWDETGQPLPSPDYPVFPVYYNITENPKLIERKGRAHLDMHDQEALTMLWTGYVNGHIRASEVYAALKQSDMAENPEITQTEFIIDPGHIIKKPIEFFSMPWPEADMLTAAQALRTENSSAAGQVDFAAQARKDSRKTAKELSLAEESTNEARTIPLTMFAIGYGQMLEFMWAILEGNIQSGYNQNFLAEPENQEVRLQIAAGLIQLKPAGDIDYIERNEKLKKYTNYYPMFANTPVGSYFMKQILQLAFPGEYEQMEPLLQDTSMQMGQVLLQALSALPVDAMVQQGIMTPEDATKLQQLIQQAGQALTPPQTQQPPTPNAPTATT